MQLTVLRTIEELDELAVEWNHLLANSASDVPFLRHEYLTTWWRTLGGGEWPSGELFVVTARQEGGQLCGIAPLFFTQNREGKRALLLLGSIEISDYLDLIARPEDLPAFIPALLDFLSGPQAPAWQMLDWYNLPESSPTLAELKKAAGRCGWVFTQEPLQHCPYIPLPGDWEAYLSGIDKKQRHEVRRKIRRAEEYLEPVCWYIVDDEASLEAETDAFLELMAQDEKKERFLTESMRAQMHLTVQAAFRAGWLQLAFIEVGGQKAAAYLNFDYANHIWVYNSGLNVNYRELSPGWVLLGRLLQWANENMRAAFDFMRGEEDYKYRLGGIDRQIVRVNIRR
ncbi:MAG TPA: GNAT family N-acetyltransferase [Anaerolineales bacterium]